MNTNPTDDYEVNFSYDDIHNLTEIVRLDGKDRHKEAAWQIVTKYRRSPFKAKRVVIHKVTYQ